MPEVKSGLPDILSCVKKAEDILPAVNTGLNETSAKLRVVHDITGEIEETLTCLTKCIKALKALSEGATVLSVVPVVGSIANVLSKVLKSTEGALNAVSAVLNEIKNTAKVLEGVSNGALAGTDKIRNVSGDLQLFLPKVVKTVTVLDYVIQIAEIVEPVAAGTTLGEKVDNLNHKINGIIGSAEESVSDIAGVYQDFCGIMNDIKAKCQEMESKIAGIKTVISSIEKISGFLSPIGNAVEKIINAIAPIKWVLQAAACLINKILSPVIDAILKVTGLKKLIDEVGEKIKSCLGFDRILDEIKSAVGNLDLTNKLREVAGFGGKIEALTAKISESLGDFSPLGNKSLGDSLRGMLGDLFHADFDPAKPVLIPDWPEEPVLAYACGISASGRKNAPVFDWNEAAEPLGEMNSLRLFCGYPDTLVSSGSGGYPQCLALQEKADAVTQGVTELAGQYNRLTGTLGLFQNAVRLPDLFKTEIHSVSVYLVFISRFLAFLADLQVCSEWRDRILEIGKWIDGQTDVCSVILDEVEELQSAVQKYHDFVSGIREMIKAEEINTFVVSVNTYGQNLQSLLDAFYLALAHNPDESELAELEKAKASVLKNAGELLGILSDATVEISRVSGYCRDIHSDVSIMFDAYQKISPDGFLLPEGTVTGLEKTAYVLSEIQGIFDPLESLLEVLRGNSYTELPVPFSGGAAGRQAKAVLEKFAEKTVRNAGMESVLDILDDLSPLSFLQDELRKFIDTQLQVNETRLAGLKHGIERICELLTEGVSYELNGQTVENRFLDQEDVGELTALSIQIAGGEDYAEG